MPVYGPTDILISDTWNGLWDGSIENSLREADVMEWNEIEQGEVEHNTTGDILVEGGWGGVPDSVG